ncbi:hypothetical protein [Bradyrhizobium sp. USDA 4508]
MTTLPDRYERHCEKDDLPPEQVVIDTLPLFRVVQVVAAPASAMVATIMMVASMSFINVWRPLRGST